MRDQARELQTALGARRVLLKGGHAGGEEAVDVWADGEDVVELRAPRVDTVNTHGTGCTLSSAVVALLARGRPWADAVREAKGWLTHALEHADSLGVGQGPGPVHHFWDRW